MSISSIEGVADERAARQRQVGDVVLTEPPNGIVGSSPAVEWLRESIKRVAVSDRPVMIIGPMGSGKALVARAIHALGPHPRQPLLELSGGAVQPSDPRAESQLFGHERGAFLAADRRQDGYLSAVRRGTIFFDEISELSLAVQAKLLAVLETRRFRRMGGGEELAFGGRIVAASRFALERRVEAGRFREDLWYRLGVLLVRVPPLEERRQDIPALVAHFVQGQPRRLRFTDAALQALAAARWPGNVRQLRNYIDRLAVFANSDEIDVDTLAAIDAAGRSDAAMSSLDSLVDAILELPIERRLQVVERVLFRAAMVKAGGNKSETARILGVHRKVVERRLASFDGTATPRRLPL